MGDGSGGLSIDGSVHIMDVSLVLSFSSSAFPASTNNNGPTDPSRLKLLLRIIEKDRRMRSFTDVIGYAIGPIGERVVTVLFFCEFALWM